MAAGGWDPMVGSEVHGFITYADLNCDKLMEEAASRWFRPNEIYALLANHARFKVQAQPLEKPPSGTVVLYDRKVVRNFRKDGHNWKKKKDGKTVQEAHEKLKIGTEERVHVYYARGEDDPNFFRRCYWLLDKDLERIVLVHYRQTSEENAVVPPNTETEVAEVPLINTILHTSPLTSVDSSSSSAHNELSCSATVVEEINSGVCSAISNEPQKHDSSLDEINTFWEDLLVSSMKNDPPICGDPLMSNQHSEHGMRESLNNVTNSMPNTTFLPSYYASEAYASDLGLNKAPDSYFLALKDQEDQSHSFLTSNLDPQSGEFKLSASGRTALQDCVPNKVPARQNSLGLLRYLENDDLGSWGNQGSAVLTSQNQSATDEKLFNITDISPGWAYSTEETKVLVVGYFYEQGKHLTGSNMYCVVGGKCVAAEIVQAGVYRCMAGPHEPGSVNFYLTLDGHTPISQVMSFEYRVMPISSSNGGVSSFEHEDKTSKLQMQMRLARLLFTTVKKKLPSKLCVEGSKAYNLASASTEKEWTDLWKFVNDSKGTYVPAAEGLLELVLRNRLQEWLLEKIIEGSKSTGRDDQGQGAIHLCSILDYTWAIRLFSLSGFSLDFRDSSGWTALHWASYFGREKMVAALLSAGANPSLVTDPTYECPGGYTAADLAAKQGYEGLAAYLAEKGLAAHFESMSLNTESASKAKLMKLQSEKFENLSEQELCLRESLAAYRNAADAASNIQAALRERTLKLQTKAVQLANPEIEAAEIVAAMRIQHAYRNYSRKKLMRAAARIQSHFRTWKMRRNFINMRRQATKIQAVYRGHLVRKQYCKVIWSVGVLEKAILRWRKKRRGLRGIGAGMPITMNLDAEPISPSEEDFFQVGRQQAEDRFNRSIVRVQALFRSYRAQQEYRRMKITHEQAKLEFS